MRKTFFVDIDGTLLKHINDFENINSYSSLDELPNAKGKLAQWHCQGHLIILTTARAESLRYITEKQLQNAGIIYDCILMGIGAGKRVLINDYAEGTEHKAVAYNVLRNKDGLNHIFE